MKKLWIGVLVLGLLAASILLAAGRPSPGRAALAVADVRKRDSEILRLAAVTEGIGGYVEQVDDVALAVESSGRIHVLWTGELNPYFGKFAFYSTSTDGVNWTPYQVLNYWMAYDPQLVVDDTHHRAHLMYRSNYDGILHHTVTNGVVAEPTVLDSDAVVFPTLSVDPVTGFVHAVWRQGYEYPLNPTTISWRFRTWYAYWNGTTWSSRQRVINDADNWDSTVAAAPDGGIMLAWFQQWSQSLGGPVDPGKPTVPRTAYGTSPAQFPLRQGVSDPYPVPEKDNSILLTFSPGDAKYYMTCYHLMWPGHSRVYRYTWQDETWSVPLDVAENISGWAVPWYLGAAQDRAFVYHVYNNDGLWSRTEIDGVLGAPQSLDDYLSDRGYTGTPVAFFVDAGGDVHMVVNGAKDGVAGFYYLSP